MAIPETLKEWKVAITLVGQEYKSTEEYHNYKTNTGTIYGGRGQLMDIGRFNDNFKDGKRKKKEQEMRKCFKCDKEEHIAKDCKGKQTMKNRKVKENSDDKDDKKEKGFGNDLK